ncbi:MAG: RodZ domain-containing protein [Candidatus Adiutrix sp.]
MTELGKDLETLGAAFKMRREVKGLTRRDVVVKIKIPLEQLEAIEEGQLSTLPPVFAKGFLRAYANELGLDAEEILDDYRRITGGSKNEPANNKPLAPRYVETSVGRSYLVPAIKFFLITFLLILGLVLAYWLSPHFRATVVSVFPSLGQVPSAELIATTSEIAPDEFQPESVFPDALISDENENEQNLSPPKETADEETETSMAPPQEVSPIALGNTPPTAPQSTAGGRLVISSQQDKVWAQVVVDNKLPEFLYLKTGETATFEPQQTVTVTTGQANALALSWNGTALAPMNRRIVEITLP